MQTTIDRFKQYHHAATELTNGMGLIHPDRDGCFFGISKAVIASQMLKLSARTGKTDPEALLETLREIHNAAALEIRGGLPAYARVPLVDLLVEVQQ